MITFEVKMRGKRKLEGNDEGRELIFIWSMIPAGRDVQRTMAHAGVVVNIVPDIIGFDEQKEWQMMRNGGSITDEAFDQETLIDTVCRMQKLLMNLSMNYMNKLEADGLRVRDSEWVQSNVESIQNRELLDWHYVRYGEVNAKDKDLVAKTRAKVGLIQKKCREVTKLRLPNALVHGDFYEWNVGSLTRLEGKVYRNFDWAHSFIGNPLYDFESLLQWHGSCDRVSGLGQISFDRDAVMEQVTRVWKHVVREETLCLKHCVK